MINALIFIYDTWFYKKWQRCWQNYWKCKIISSGLSSVPGSRSRSTQFLPHELSVSNLILVLFWFWFWLQVSVSWSLLTCFLRVVQLEACHASFGLHLQWNQKLSWWSHKLLKSGIFCGTLSKLLCHRQGTSFQYQKSHLDLVVWYWDECGNPSRPDAEKVEPI